MILLITKDLFFVPTLKNAAENAGAELTTALSADSAKVKELAAETVSTCIVDLSNVKVDDMANLFAELRRLFPGARLVAFGPHVQEQRLSAARAAGVLQVLTRGQLSSQIERLMQDWVTRP